MKKEKKTIGVISDRDIQTLFLLAGANYKVVKAGDVCNDPAYIVRSNTHLSEVVAEMATLKVGIAVVVDSSLLVGIFNTADACRALATIIYEMSFSRPDLKFY